MKVARIVIALMTLSTAAWAAKAPKTPTGGTAYVCWTADNSVHFTANLSEDLAERAVVVSVDLAPKIYSEFKGKKKNYSLIVGAPKNTTLQVRKTAKSPLLVSLETDPENAHVVPAHSAEGISITKFDAFLTDTDSQLSHEPVKCLETKWQ